MDEVRASTTVPMVAGGGIMTGPDAADVMRRGAVGVQLGTAFLCCPEAGTSAPYRRALREGTYRDTMLTRAFSGRYARGLANGFAVTYSAAAPEAYPEVHHLTRPLRAAATEAGDPDIPNLWAGAGWRAVTTLSLIHISTVGPGHAGAAPTATRSTASTTSTTTGPETALRNLAVTLSEQRCV